MKQTAEAGERQLRRSLEAAWGTAPGWGRLAAVNHTVLGRRFIVAAFVFFLIGGLLAMLIRAQLATPGNAFVGPEVYGQIFTMHGTAMMFLFAIPMLEGWAVYLLPKLLGARDLAFPRLTAYGFWCYVFGGSIMIAALAVGAAPDGGWFMYTPLTSERYSPGVNADVWLLGVTFVEISAMSAAVEIIVSILKIRAPGMSLDRMPIYAWYFLVTFFMILVGFPPLILASILLEAERAIGWPFFDPTRGGDPLLWQHLFWIFGHPEVYIILLPGAGAISTILPVFARHPLVGYRWIVVSIVALGFLSFGLWVHHMFVVGLPHIAKGFFSAASMLVTVPTAVQIFSWIATLASGRPQLKLPMLFLLGFFFIFVAGGLTGVMVAAAPFDWQAHDTHFIVAHLHYVLVGGFVFPMLAAAYYWLPHFTGKTPAYRLGSTAFWLIFIGFNLTFFQMHLTGLLGMPRRVYAYPDGVGWETLNLVSSIGGFLSAIGFAVFILDFALQLRFGHAGRRNPWGAETLEWATDTPPASYGFMSLPRVKSRRPLHDDPDLPDRLAAGEGYLGFVRNGGLETLGVHMVAGRPEQVVRLPGPTFLPLWSALATGAFFLSLLFKIYWLAPAALAATVALLFSWTRSTGSRIDRGALPIGCGEAAPPHEEADGAPSWWAMLFALIADAALLASLLFGFVFLWIFAPAWPPEDIWRPGYIVPATTILALAGAAVFGSRAVSAAARGECGAWLPAAGASHVAALALALVQFVQAPQAAEHAYAASASALLVYVAIHAALGALLAFYGLWRCRRGYVSPRRTLDLRIGKLWHVYTGGAGIGALLVAYGVSGAVGA